MPTSIAHRDRKVPSHIVEGFVHIAQAEFFSARDAIVVCVVDNETNRIGVRVQEESEQGRIHQCSSFTGMLPLMVYGVRGLLLTTTQGSYLC